MKPTVLLFDVDGTLVTTCGAGRRAVERAFELRHGSKDILPFSFGGMTDKAIIRDALLALGLSFASDTALESEIDATLDFYLGVLAEEVTRAQIRIHEGMVRAMDMADARPDVALGLGTGNIRKGAEIKLRCVDIFDRFSFGGFGGRLHRPTCSSDGRCAAGCRQVGRAHRRLPHRHHRRPRPRTSRQPKRSAPSASLWPRACHDAAELRACEPTAVFANLADPRAPEVLFGK